MQVLIVLAQSAQQSILLGNFLMFGRPDLLS